MSNALTPLFITGYSKGLMTNKKPFLLPDQAWSTMENGYVWRERELKREGNKLLGRLQRDLTSQSLGATVGAQLTYDFTDILTTLSLRSTEPNAEIRPGKLVITIGAPDTATFTDNGDGTFTATGAGLSAGSYVNYSTGHVVLVLSASTGGGAISANFSYFPGLPGMGTWQRELSTINEDQTIWWDTKYAYIFVGTAFQEFIPGITWAGLNSDFFWAYNYQGAAGTRLLFVTNFVSDAADPMRYTDGITWTTFAPLVTATITLFQARIIIPYYGRLVLLNTWEGTTMGGAAAATQFFNRCRFSGPFGADPTGVDAFRTDKFGFGGSIDAPTSEAITGCTFVKNTLIVDFEYSTWQLRYVGEYGLPFIWERISSDFGSGSTFSGVLFDNHRLNVGDVGITAGNAIGVDRIDLEIPDQVFDIQDEQTNNGAQRVWGVRDFQRELIFWNYPDAQSQSIPGVPIIFPNKVLLYNYRNNTWAIFRDSVTCFGTFQIQSAVTWSDLEITWDDEKTTWDDPINQIGFPDIVKTNQQGFVHLFGYKTQDDPSLSVTEVSTSFLLLNLKIPSHNLFTGEIIYLQGLQFIDSTTFLPVPTSLNDKIYAISVIDADTISLSVWNFTTSSYNTIFPYTPVISNVIYVGGGVVTLFPRLNIITKDINLFQAKGLQTKLSRLDFLMEPQANGSAVTINLILNSASSLTANILMTPPNLSIQTPSYGNDPVQQLASEYYWFSFYQTLYAQYFRIQLTYSESLMNTLLTHQTDLTLYAINAWVRPGGRMANP
jgi:hypothetical protein